MNKPLISIITPNFNGAAFISEAYRSVQCQTETNWEWIIVDDNSSDKSRELIEEIAALDPRVSPIFIDINSGAAAARNAGLDIAQGDYIAFLDIDDRWENEKLETSLKYMQATKADFIYTNYLKVKNSILGTQIIGTPSEIDYVDLLKTCHICTSTVVIRRQVIGMTRMEIRLRRGQDYVFWLQILKKIGKAQRASEKPLTTYTIGNASLSSNKIRKAYFQWYIYRKVLNLRFLESVYYFLNYAFYGFVKFRKF